MSDASIMLIESHSRRYRIASTFTQLNRTADRTDLPTYLHIHRIDDLSRSLLSTQYAQASSASVDSKM